MSRRSLGADPELHDGILDAVCHEAGSRGKSTRLGFGICFQKTLRQAWLKASQMVGPGKPTKAFPNHARLFAKGCAAHETSPSASFHINFDPHSRPVPIRNRCHSGNILLVCPGIFVGLATPGPRSKATRSGVMQKFYTQKTSENQKVGRATEIQDPVSSPIRITIQPGQIILGAGAVACSLCLCATSGRVPGFPALARPLGPKERAELWPC